MEQDSESDREINRRKLLALFGTALAPLLSGTSSLLSTSESQSRMPSPPTVPELNNNSESERDETENSNSNGENDETENSDSDEETENSDSDEENEETTTHPGANIVDHGGIEGEDSIRAAEANVSAIHSASVASEDNLVYLPEGKWYVGLSDRSKFLNPGDDSVDRGVAGLGFTGDGPEKSFLIVSETADSSSGLRILYENVPHGNTTWDNITYDGNSDNIDFESVQWGISIRGDGRFTFDNVRFRNFQGNMLRGTSSGGYSMEFDRCTFTNIAIERLNETEGSSTGHAIVVSIDVENHLNVTNCYGELIGGAFIDLGSSTQGDVMLNNCCTVGISDGLLKVNNGNVIDISNVYYQGWSPELADAVYDESQAGRNFIYILDSSTAPKQPTLKLNDIEGRHIGHHIVSARQGHGFDIEGGDEGPLVFVDGGNLSSGGFREDSDTDSHFKFEIGQISIHNFEGDLFRTPNSMGTIESLHRDWESDLGSTGEITFQSNTVGASPFEANVPDTDEVGINTDHA